MSFLNHPIPQSARWRHVLILFFAAMLLPLGTVHAQKPDRDAVGKRLRVAAGGPGHDGRQVRARLLAMRKKLGEAVKAGKLSREDAGKKLRAAAQGARRRMAAGPRGAAASSAKRARRPDRVKVYLMRVKKELGAAIKADKISEADAKKRYAAASKGIAQRMAIGRQRSSGRARPAQPRPGSLASLSARVRRLESTVRRLQAAVRRIEGAKRKNAGRDRAGRARRAPARGVRSKSRQRGSKRLPLAGRGRVEKGRGGAKRNTLKKPKKPKKKSGKKIV